MRHGEPVLTERMLGRTDCAVTAQGVAACVDAAAALSFESVLASDLARARTCAQAIAAGMNRTVAVDPRWRELDFGAWDGCSAGDVDQATLGRFWDDPDARPPPDGERWSELVARVSAALDDLADQTLVVTHAGAIRAALSAACGFDVRQTWAFALPYACVVTLRLWQEAAPSGQIVALSSDEGARR
nr:histidine phosphatase family protein [Sphingomonas gellani]